MSKIKKFIIDGRNFTSLHGFYKEIVKVIAPKFNGFGNNYDAFDDVLYGGTGPFNFKEKITLIWDNFDKSEKELPTEELIHLLEILRNHKSHISLILKRKGDKIE